MTKRTIAPILAGLLISIGAGVLVVHAVETSYAPLAPLPIGDAGAIPTAYTLSSYLSGMIKLLIALGAATAILFAIIGGIQYVAAGIAPSAKQDAKDRITNAFIGLTIMLTSYLLLNSINPDLVNLKFELPAVQVAISTGTGGPGIYNCMQEVVIPTLTTQGFACTKATPGTDCYKEGQKMYKCIKGTWHDDTEVRSQFTANDIPVQGTNTNAPCLIVDQTGCTSVYNLPYKAILGVITLKEKSGAPVVVTGGTEYWSHQTHGSASSFAAIVDLRKNPSLNTYITTKGTCTPTGISCGVRSAQHCTLTLATATGFSKGTYVDEGNHWHVCY